MSEMLERAELAIGAIEWEVGEETYRTLGDIQRQHCVDLARAALLAALDPEDEALVASLKSTINDFCVGRLDDEAQQALACEIVSSLKRIAQGERTVSDDQGRKD